MLERRVLTYVPKEDIPSSAWEYTSYFGGSPNVIYIPLNGANPRYTESLTSHPAITCNMDSATSILSIGPFLFSNDTQVGFYVTNFTIRMHYYTNYTLDVYSNETYDYAQPEIQINNGVPFGLGLGYIVSDYLHGNIIGDTIYYIKIKFSYPFSYESESDNMRYSEMYLDNCPIFLDYE